MVNPGANSSGASASTLTTRGLRAQVHEHPQQQRDLGHGQPAERGDARGVLDVGTTDHAQLQRGQDDQDEEPRDVLCAPAPASRLHSAHRQQ